MRIEILFLTKIHWWEMLTMMTKEMDKMINKEVEEDDKICFDN